MGLVLRCYALQESLWLDELHTAWAVSADGSELGKRARLGNNGQLYFILVGMITNSFGMREWTLRLLSVTAGSLLIPATYFLVKRWRCAPWACLLAAALIAIDRNAIFYAGEARPYCLAQLVALVHLYLFSRLLLLQQHTWVWIFWVISGIGLFHLHCTTALVFAAESVAYGVLVLLRRDLKLHWLYFLIGIVIIGLGMLPAAGLLRQLAERRENWAFFVSRTGNPFSILWIYPLWVYALVPLLVGLLTMAVERFRIRPDDGPAAAERAEVLLPLVLLAAWILVPITATWLLTEFDIARLFYVRYVAATAVALAPLAGVLFSWLAGRRAAAPWGAGIVLAIAVAAISPARDISLGTAALRHSSEDWRTPVGLINRHSADIPVILYSGLIEADQWHKSSNKDQRAYCQFPVHGLYRVPAEQQVIVLPKSLPIALSSAERERVTHDGAWLLLRGTTQVRQRVAGEVLASLDNPPVETQFEFGNIALLRIFAPEKRQP